MNKIEQLIAKYCPDGVEYKELEILCNIKTGKLNANAANKSGKYKFFTCGSDVLNIDTYAFDTEALLISGNGANVGYIHYYNGKFNAYQRTYVLDCFKNTNIHFVKYYLSQFLKQHIFINKKDSGIPYIVLDTLAKLKIPIPPIEVQEEIVKILDKFTALEAELAARRKQYEYYREKLLTFPEAV